MENWWRYAVVFALYLPLIAIFDVGPSQGRDLRPSEHGLDYQNNATTKSPEMLSFFGGKSSSSVAPGSPFPEAKNATDDESWWKDASVSGRGGGGRKRNHVREALVAATVACGATGVALLVVAALLFAYRYQKQKSTGRTKQ
ncbi:uncharacterized protein LOC127792770 [Diospyros lotus]|uniref:uncharacterized protein LOC127792770 n=1 Tax=Diospyros lotus TaxID=55363 RepID=UPI0022509711|nr:uncharacterized protein LOC127792770 [Diospyros lotus]